MINISIPKKNIIQLPAIYQTAVFNTDVIGKFSINKDRVDIAPLDKNSIYLLSAFSFSTSLPENDFLTSLDINNMLKIQFKTKKNIHVFKFPITLLNYHQNSELNTYISTQNSDDTLQASLNGQFFQIANTIGLQKIVISISLFMYQIDNVEYNKFFNADMKDKESGKY